MKIVTASLLLYVALSLRADGGDCERAFTKSGNPLTGTKFQSWVKLKDLSVENAVAQMHGIAIEKKLDILTEDPAGSMLLEYRASSMRRAIPYLVSVSKDGDAAVVQILVKLEKGVLTKADSAKEEICSLLGALKSGDEGAAAAEMAARKEASEGATKRDAFRFSLDLGNEMKASPESIPLRYKGRVFTLSGRVDYVQKDGAVYRVAFELPEKTSGPALLGGDTWMVRLSCLMAPSQAAYALTLRPKEKITLTGRYYDFDSFKRVMWLEECKPEAR